MADDDLRTKHKQTASLLHNCCMVAFRCSSTCLWLEMVQVRKGRWMELLEIKYGREHFKMILSVFRITRCLTTQISRFKPVPSNSQARWTGEEENGKVRKARDGRTWSLHHTDPISFKTLNQVWMGLSFVSRLSSSSPPTSPSYFSVDFAGCCSAQPLISPPVCACPTNCSLVLNGYFGTQCQARQ